MIEVQIVAYEGEFAQHIRAVRDQVFIKEQGIDPALEFDGQDSNTIHALVSVDGAYVGTGRMFDDGHIGRIAVLSDYRSMGIGSKIVNALTERAIKQHYPRVYLGAQKQAIDFYARLGFKPFGDEFIEADIVHLAMEKLL
ncbi:GNAT family N-acetyltransferase [Celerinatantimonas sp. MCCC 1A17872]|uniref:GNAT family N-acetyltransferase n=1 Tax=Celerinatantimonas sp. MCCC 1A17872 TaxID=3177514 RepID=UPI0038C90079